jgi:hypothetical protein
MLKYGRVENDRPNDPFPLFEIQKMMVFHGIGHRANGKEQRAQGNYTRIIKFSFSDSDDYQRIKSTLWNPLLSDNKHSHA